MVKKLSDIKTGWDFQDWLVSKLQGRGVDAYPLVTSDGQGGVIPEVQVIAEGGFNFLVWVLPQEDSGQGSASEVEMVDLLRRWAEWHSGMNLRSDEGRSIRESTEALLVRLGKED